MGVEIRRISSYLWLWRFIAQFYGYNVGPLAAPIFLQVLLLGIRGELELRLKDHLA